MNTIITIGRQFGSGGHEIGNRIADYYDIKCYDKELIARTSDESGLSKEMIAQQEEKPTGSFLYQLVMDSFSFGYHNSGLIDMPVGQKVFLAQFEAIKRIAQEGPCVIVGRCAEYALQDLPNVIRVFVVADEDFKIQNLRRRFPDLTSDDQARDLMKQKDKQRKQYHNHYASTSWGHAESYDLVINSGVLGIEGSAKLVTQFVDDYEEMRG